MKTMLTERLLGSSDYDRQEEIECEAFDRGVERYRRFVDEAVSRGEAHRLKPAQRLLLHWLPVITEAVTKEKRACIRRNDPGPGANYYTEILSQCDSEEAAFIACSVTLGLCLDSPGGVTSADVTTSIGRALVAQLNWKAIRKEGSDMRRDLERRFRFARPEQINWFAGKFLEEPVRARRAMGYIGARLFYFLLTECWVNDYTEETPILAFRRETIRNPTGRGLLGMVWPTDALLDVIEDGHLARQSMRPVYPPMVVPPFRPDASSPAGYLKIRTPIIPHPSHDQREQLDKADLTRLYDGLAAVGGVAQRISPRMRQVVTEEYKRGGGSVRIPRRNDPPEPPYPGREQLKNPEVKEAFYAERREWHDARVANASERTVFSHVLEVADRFADEPRLYFPHHIDYRGRAYPLPPHLHFQGPDTSRALLEFADEKPVDERAIKIHAANCYGFDKVPFDERVAWIDERAGMISDALSRPHDDDWWRTADKPLQFLAALYALDEGNGRLPCQKDGTCNGLQHYSAMGRDRVGAEAVNLLPSDVPVSVYWKIADALRPVLEDYARDDMELIEWQSVVQGKRIRRAIRRSEVARELLAMLGKDVVKQNVMTLVYGVTAFGARDQVRGVLAEKGLEGHALTAGSMLMANSTLAATAEVVVAASQIMDWLQTCARMIAKSGRVVQMDSPVGLPVVLPYRKWGDTIIDTNIGSISLLVETEDVDVSVFRQTNASAPGFVHMIDSAHMFNATVRAAGDGVSIIPVHDAFSSHSCDMDYLGEMLVDEFVELHREPQHYRQAELWRERYPDLDLPEPPPLGTLDIDEVRGAPFAFS